MPAATAAIDPAVLWQVAGWVGFGVGALVLVLALFKDRSRGRRRCPGCWYDMSGAVSRQEAVGREVFTCPECGRVVKGERGLRRTRRRWRWVLLSGLLMGIAYGSWCVTPVRKNGWPAALPDLLLAAVAPIEPEVWPLEPNGSASSALTADLHRRIIDEELHSYAFQVFLGRIFESDQAEAERVVQTRDQWPRGERVWVKLRPPSYLWRESDRVLVRARLQGATSWVERDWGATRGAKTMSLGVPATDAGSVGVEVEIDLRLQSGERVLIYRGMPRVVELVPSDAAVVEPLGKQSADHLVEWKLEPRVFIAPDGVPVFQVRCLGSHIGESSVDWSVSMKAELLRYERVVAKAELVVPMPGPHTHATTGYLWNHVRMAFVEGAQGVQAHEPLTLRIKGDRSIALRDLHRTIYWDGEIELNLGDSPLPMFEGEAALFSREVVSDE